MLREEQLPWLADAPAGLAPLNEALARHARVAAECAATIEAGVPDMRNSLVTVANQLRGHVDSLGHACERTARARIASLGAYLHICARHLHGSLIPPWNADAFEAARRMDDAALCILALLDNDFGNL